MKSQKEEIWPYLADTSRFNRALGIAPRTEVEKDGKRWVTTSLLGMTQQWIEEPWSWLSGQTLSASRVYSQGIAKNFQAVFHIDSDSHQDRRLIYIYFGWEPTTWFWKGFLSLTSGYLKAQFHKTLSQIDQGILNLRAVKENILKREPEPFSPDRKEAMSRIRAALIEKKIKPEVIAPLFELIEKGDDFDLESIRIGALACCWKVDLRELTVACLHATRLSLLNLSWKVICPHCRGSRVAAKTLGEIPESAACEVCDIQFTTDKEQSIEVVFTVHPSIRIVREQLYCSGEPGKKAHIKMQRKLLTQEEFEVDLDLPQGVYRIRQTTSQQVNKFKVEPGIGNQVFNLNADSTGTLPNTGSGAKIRYRNHSPESTTLIVEEFFWENDVLRPVDVFSVPEFRDLFSADHLNSQVKLFLGEQCILFTDIVGSTRFYKQVGDARAFLEVRGHFQDVFEKIHSERGIVVKTIGDAVMASFASPQEALQAALHIQEKFHAQRSDTQIRLRISIHAGPVIAVQLNTGIDYFGNTVNQAAKIQSFANAGEIAVTEGIYQLYQKNYGPEARFSDWSRMTNRRDTDDISEVYVLKTYMHEARKAS